MLIKTQRQSLSHSLFLVLFILVQAVYADDYVQEPPDIDDCIDPSNTPGYAYYEDIEIRGSISGKGNSRNSPPGQLAEGERTIGGLIDLIVLMNANPCL